MTIFAVETVDQCCDDIQPLLLEHHREVALHQEHVPLDPDFDRYREIERQGALVVITARRNAEMVGYSVFFVTSHIHYRACLMATNDVLFLRRDCRGTIGVRLIRESERVLQARGVDRITWHAKRDELSSVLQRLGYDVEEVVLGKLLKGEKHGN